MPDHDQEQPKDKPAESDPVEVRKPEARTSEQDMSRIPTRWQRIKEHPAFKPVLVVGGLVALSAVTFLALGSDEAIEQVLEKDPEYTGADFDGTGQEASRKSPTEHEVNAYTRSQHYGPGRTETKIIQVRPYSRGGSA